MENTQESVADIIEEMRNLGKLDEKSIDKIPRTLMGLGLRTYADRLDAAIKREREAVEADALFVGGIVEAERHKPGNAAATYEALVRVKRLFDGRLMWQPDIRKAHEAVNAALASPPRVCDVNTLESLSDFVERIMLTSGLLKDTHEIVKSIVVASVRTALTIAYEPAKEIKAKEGDVHA